MNHRSRRATLALLSLAALTAVHRTGFAQAAWPEGKPIRLIVPYPAGGVTDAVARLLADKLAAPLGSNIVIENRAGASGLIGMDVLAKAPADGHTLAFTSVSTLTITPHLGNKMPFDPGRDIAPVISFVHSPAVILATPVLAVRDFKGLLAEAKARPGAVRWSTSGQGSMGQLMLEQVKLAAKVDITHIPYRGSAQQLTDAVGGQMEVVSANITQTLMQQIRTGKLRPLAVGADARLEALPDVPTFTELGIPKANRSSTLGLFAPARTPAAVVQRLNAEINKLLAQPDVHKQLIEMGNVPAGGSSAAFVQAIADESVSNAQIIKTANIRAE
jgi:tripartite-type tricarboxylate transporter receptor subunit TctC